MTMNRREFITVCGSLTLVGSPLFNARAAGISKRNLVIIMLRGGMDGLTAVQPRDKAMERARPDILVQEAKKLTSDFNLHPRLETFYECWKEGTASVFHATSIPYTGRSHFDGQNLMETGAHVAYSEKTGWLGRGMDAAELQGLAVSLPMPLLLRGSNDLDNYFPTYMRLPAASDMEMINTSYTPGSDLERTMRRVLQRPLQNPSHGPFEIGPGCVGSVDHFHVTGGGQPHIGGEIIVEVVAAPQQQRHRQRHRKPLQFGGIHAAPEPAGLFGIGDVGAGFHEVLPVKMRAAGIGNRGGMENRRRAFLPAFVECFQARMKVEVRRQLFRFLDEDVRPGPLHRLVTWLDGSKPVHSAAEHNDHQIALRNSGGASIEQG